MTTTTKMQDHLGRWLVNANPGSSDATDTVGRSVIASNKDYLGRALGFTKPSNWAQSTAKSLGDCVFLSGGAVLQCTTAGTTASGSAPSAPALHANITDGSVVWKRIK